MKVYSQQDFSDCVAAPYPVVVKQADGTSLQVLGKGNSQYHMATTLDGYPVVRNAEGIYEYAVKNRENKWVASGKRASDPGDRKQREKRLLTSLSGEIFGSPAEDVAAAFPEKTAALQSEVLTEKVFPSYGTRKVLLLLIKYSDLENTYTVSDLDELINEANYRGTGSFSDYFYQASGGKLTIDADVFGWYTAANDYYYYRWNDEGSEVARVFAS